MIQSTSTKRPTVRSDQLAAIHAATGLGMTTIRRLLDATSRPSNPIIAAAWDDALAELGLSPKAVAR